MYFRPDMYIPFWKKWLSYAVPLTLESTTSEQNPELAVVLDRGRLQLLSGNAIYSWDDLYHNFTRAFGAIDLEKYPIEHVLLLGLGLGSVPYILEKVYQRNYYYTAVEWDETVSVLAGKYTFSRLKSSVEIVTADAGIFIRVAEDRYDLIVIDLFEDDHTPGYFETRPFLEDCESRLKPGGLLLYNRLYNTPQNKASTDKFFEQAFRHVFPGSYKIDTGGNWILVNTR